MSVTFSPVLTPFHGEQQQRWRRLLPASLGLGNSMKETEPSPGTECPARWDENRGVSRTTETRAHPTSHRIPDEERGQCLKGKCHSRGRTTGYAAGDTWVTSRMGLLSQDYFISFQCGLLNKAVHPLTVQPPGPWKLHPCPLTLLGWDHV